MDSPSQTKSSIRRAIKAGSWYEASPRKLDREITKWLSDAGPSVFGPAKAIISPHAGYMHCGPCAAHAYKEISPDVSTIFILGPSHHVRLNGIALSSATEYETPFSNLIINQEIYKELKETNQFDVMSLRVDEEEHSLELQLPYIAKVMEKRSEPFTIVPMMVGSIRPEKEEMYGRLLSKYLLDPSVVFVVSSDFCHWGKKFDYNFYDTNWGFIYQSIEQLDKLGMKAIKDLKLNSFKNYLKKYGNTICGRHPISVLIAALEDLNSKSSLGSGKPRYSIKFHKYMQSSKCMHTSHSSVSYAAASVKEFDSNHELVHLEDIVDV